MTFVVEVLAFLFVVSVVVVLVAVFVVVADFDDPRVVVTGFDDPRAVVLPVAAFGAVGLGVDLTATGLGAAALGGDGGLDEAAFGA